MVVDHLGQLGFETWLPRVGDPLKPYFPGYFFVLAIHFWMPPRGTRGMGKLLGAPSPLRPGVIERLREAVDAATEVEEVDEVLETLAVGTEVTVMGKRGTVSWSSSTRVRAMLQLFGRTVSVEVDRRRLRVEVV